MGRGDTSKTDADEATRLKDEGNSKIRDSQDFIGAVISYSRAIELDSSQFVYYNNRAVAYMYLKEFRKALRDCDASLRLKENHRGFSRRAAVLCEMGYLDDAVGAVDQALSLRPDDKQSIELRAFLVDTIAKANNYINIASQKIKHHNGRERDGEYESAIEAYTHAIHLYQANYRFFNRRAAAYLQAGDIESGMADCDSSIKLYENARAYSFKAAALGELGRLSEGLACVDRALELSPEDRLSLKTRQDLLDLQTLVRAAEERRRLDEQMQLQEATIKQEEDYLFHNYLAREALQLGDLERVLQCCDDSLKLCRSCEAYCLQVRALVELGRIDEGLSAISKSLDLDPEHAESLVLEEWLVRAKSEQDKRECDEGHTQEGGFDELMVQHQYSLGDSYYAEEGTVVELEGSHEDPGEQSAEEEEEEHEEVQEEGVFVRKQKMLEYVELFDEGSHIESKHDDCDYEPDSASRRGSVAEESRWRRRSIDEVIEELPEPIIEDDGEPVESMGVEFKKLITTPEAFAVLDEAYQAVAHRYNYKVHDLVVTYNLPTIAENDLPGVVTGGKNAKGQYPVFVEFPAHLNKPSETRLYYPENLWSKMRADIKLEVHDTDKKFRVVSGIYLHHQYHYDRIVAVMGSPLNPSSYEVDDADDVDGSWGWSHDDVRRAMDAMKIEQDTFIHAKEKYDNPIPEFKPYKITFLKVIDTLDS